MNESEIKMKCLELALEHKPHSNPIDEARSYYDFIKGTNDAEIINAVRAVAGVINAKA